LSFGLVRVFWIFPETAWRRMNCRQAAQVVAPVSGLVDELLGRRD